MSERHLLSCSCGAQQPVSLAQAGEELTCACGQKVRVPTIRALRELPLAEAPTAPQPAAWDARRGFLFSGGLLVALLGLAVAALAWSAHSRLDVTDYTPQFVEVVNAEIDQFTPLETLRFWDLLQKGGIDDGVQPPHVLARQQAANYRVAAIVGGIVAALGIGSAIASLVQRPKRGT